MAALWNTKAGKWVNGRKSIPTLDFKDKTIWMHAASLGEFEQGRPVLEALKLEYPDYKVVVSFFSPSGYEIRKDYRWADAVIYLPLDTPSNAEKIVDQINPALVIWIKYEYWHHHLRTISRRNIPLILVSGIFRNNQPFFKWYGKLWIETLHCFTHFFVQDENSYKLLGGLVDPSKISLAGDTRFDRVLEIAENKKPIPNLERFIRGRQCLVAGSTWVLDEKMLKPFIQEHPGFCFVIAPHEIGQEHLKSIRDMYPDSILYSELGNADIDRANLLIIDNIGMLSSVYAFAQVAYVGGGFGSGIHNILEACVYGIPVVFGPNYSKFAEAIALIEAGGAFAVKDEATANQMLELLMTNPAKRQNAGQIASDYVSKQSGATKKIVDYTMLNRLLTR